MAIDLRLHTEKKRALQVNDEIVRDVIRDPAAVPFEVQMVAHVRRRFIEEMIEAKHRGDDPARVSRAINQACADMFAEFIMMTIPHTQPAMVVQMAQSGMTEMAGMVQHLIDAYLQGPPPAPVANQN